MPRRFGKFKKGDIKPHHRDTQAVRKAVNKQIQAAQETRQWLTSITSTSVTTAGLMSNTLFSPVQGNTFLNRDGDEVKYDRIRIDGDIVVASTTNALRTILFKWHQDTAVEVPVALDIVDTRGIYLGAANAPFSDIQFNQAKKKKFTVLSDQLHYVDQGNQIVRFRIHQKLAGKALFNEGVSTGKNQLFLLAISDDGAVSYPGLAYVSEITFKA